MNYEPPDSSMAIPGSSISPKTPETDNNINSFSFKVHPNTKFSSPLLHPKKPYMNQNHNNNNNGRPPMNRMHNRLGTMNNYQNPNMNRGYVNGENNNYRFFNRKRPQGNELGPMQPKRKWQHNKPYFHKNPNKQSVQSRLNLFKEVDNSRDEDNPTISVMNNMASSSTQNNESLDFDDTDITVQVVNSTALAENSTNPSRFKMVLDPKIQKSIEMLKQKRKEKQVIFPFKITPNVTEIALHERFSLL